MAPNSWMLACMDMTSLRSLPGINPDLHTIDRILCQASHGARAEALQALQRRDGRGVQPAPRQLTVHQAQPPSIGQRVVEQAVEPLE